MSTSKAALQSQAETLRKKLAASEATSQILREKLAKIDAQLTGAPVQVSGLDLLWKAALPISKTRSSKLLCRKAWNLIPKDERPTIDVMVNALKIWNRCTEWKKDGNQYALALDRWIKEQRWEDLPEVEQAGSRYPRTPAPVRQSAPGEAASAEDIAEILSVLKPKRMSS